MECGNGSIISQQDGEVKILGLTCKRWSCDSCRPLRLYQLKQMAKAGNPISFVTLTASPDHHESPDAMARALVRGWRNIIQRGQREGLFDNPQYLAVFEEHKSGWPHLHILFRGPYVDQQWLSDRMKEYAHGPNVWITKISSQRQISRYIAKYVSKGPARYEGCKRYWRSRNWIIDSEYIAKREALKARTWYYDTDSAVMLARRFSNSGWLVDGDKDGAYTCRPTDEAEAWPVLVAGPRCWNDDYWYVFDDPVPID